MPKFIVIALTAVISGVVAALATAGILLSVGAAASGESPTTTTTATDGRDGVDGRVGGDGQDGIDGQDGGDGTSGAAGPRGPGGPPGPQGPAGGDADFVSATFGGSLTVDDARFAPLSIVLPTAGVYQVFVTVSGGASADVRVGTPAVSSGFSCTVIGGSQVAVPSIPIPLFVSGVDSGSSGYIYTLDQPGSALGTVLTTAADTTIGVQCASTPVQSGDAFQDSFAVDSMSIVAIPLG